MDNNFEQNNKDNNGFESTESTENKKPWYLTPSVEVPKDYNPYRDDTGVFEETVKRTPNAFKGANQLPGESPDMYYYRRRGEWNFARSEARRGLKSSAGFIGLIILLYLALSNLFVMCIQGLFSETVTEVLMAVIQYLIVAPAVIIVANIGNKHKTVTFFKKPTVSKFFIFKWSVIGLGLTYLVSFVGNIFFTLIQAFGVNVNDLSQPIPDNPVSLIMYFLMVVIGAPIFEEILFRGVFLTHNMKYGCWHSIIVTGVLFGLVHQNHEQMFFAAALGIVFGYMDVKAGSIIPSIIAHTAVNLYSFIMTFFLYFTNFNETLPDPSLQLDGPAVSLYAVGIMNALVYALMVVAFIMLVYEFTKNKKELDLPKGDSLLTENEKYSAFFASPFMIIALVVLAIFIFLISFVDMSAITEPVLSIFR